MMTGKMYKTSISKNASIIIIMVLIEAGRPTKNFLSFIMWKEASRMILNDKNTMRVMRR